MMSSLLQRCRSMNNNGSLLSNTALDCIQIHVSREWDAHQCFPMFGVIPFPYCLIIRRIYKSNRQFAASAGNYRPVLPMQRQWHLLIGNQLHSFVCLFYITSNQTTKWWNAHFTWAFFAMAGISHSRSDSLLGAQWFFNARTISALT